MTVMMTEPASARALDLGRPFPAPDYTDRFVLETSATSFHTIDDFIRALACNQPGWLTGVSMGIRDVDAVRAAVGTQPLQPGDAIGNWAVVERSETSVVFAENMGIMAYRIGYRWESPTRIAAETEVVQRSRLLGRLYWGLATPLHKRFLTRMLHNAAGVEGSTVIEETSP